MCISDLLLFEKLSPQTTCLDVQLSSYWAVRCDCFQLHSHLVDAELPNFRRIVYLYVKQTVSSEGETRHKLLQVCTSKEGSGHRTVQTLNWLWVQECWSSFCCKHNNCVSVCTRLHYCSRDIVGTQTSIFSRPGEVWRNLPTIWMGEGSHSVLVLLMDLIAILAPQEPLWLLHLALHDPSRCCRWKRTLLERVCRTAWKLAWCSCLVHIVGFGQPWQPLYTLH